MVEHTSTRQNSSLSLTHTSPALGERPSSSSSLEPLRRVSVDNTLLTIHSEASRSQPDVHSRLFSGDEARYVVSDSREADMELDSTRRQRQGLIASLQFRYGDLGVNEDNVQEGPSLQMTPITRTSGQEHQEEQPIRQEIEEHAHHVNRDPEDLEDRRNASRFLACCALGSIVSGFLTATIGTITAPHDHDASPPRTFIIGFALFGAGMLACFVDRCREGVQPGQEAHANNQDEEEEEED